MNKKSVLNLIVITFLVMFYIGCNLIGPSITAGDVETMSASGISFDMVYVPEGLSFYNGINDAGSSSVANAYRIMSTELTYELWYAVRNWAENSANPAYTFASTGREGNDGTDGASPTEADQEPVTQISWRDAMLWCNALTEWYNAQTGTSRSCVYYTDSGYTTPIYSVDLTAIVYPNPGSQDDPYVKTDADGFRLPTRNEWELSARYIDDLNGDGDIQDEGEYYPGDYASGSTADYNDTLASQAAAWYDANSGNATHNVGQKPVSGNALALYDMCGNVFEWSFNWADTFEGVRRSKHGGSWFDTTQLLQIGIKNVGSPPNMLSDDFGMRIVKSE